MELHGYYINLSHRSDRKEHLLSQVSGLTPPIHLTRKEAVCVKENGALGCVKSHIEILEEAKTKKLPYILVLEDDFMWFIGTSESHEECAGAGPQVCFSKVVRVLEHFLSNGISWNVIMLGGANAVTHPCEYETLGLKRVESANATHAYIIHQEYYDTLLENFKEGAALLEARGKWVTRSGSPQTVEHMDPLQLDVYWNRLQQKDVWYIMNPQCATQLPSYSDVTNENVDHTQNIHN